MERDTRNLYQRLLAVMKDVTYVRKESKQGMRYSIVSHDAVTAKVRPALVNQGVVYFACVKERAQTGNRTEAVVTVTFVNSDQPADRLSVDMFGYGIDDQDKGPGKAISYAVKYALLKTLGLETGDDPDQDQEVKYDRPPETFGAEGEEKMRAHFKSKNLTLADAAAALGLTLPASKWPVTLRPVLTAWLKDQPEPKPVQSGAEFLADLDGKRVDTATGEVMDEAAQDAALKNDLQDHVEREEAHADKAIGNGKAPRGRKAVARG